VVAAAFDYLEREANPPPALRDFGPMWTDSRPLTACAGIAVVSSGYPLSAAQQVANGLCAQAKRTARDSEGPGRPRECHVAWHRGDHTSDADVSATARVYPASEFRVLLGEFLDPDEPTSLRGTQPPGPAGDERVVPWAGRRTFLRSRLAPALAGAKHPYATAKQLLEETEHIHGPIGLPSDRTNWADRVTDAVDLLDRHLQLPELPVGSDAEDESA
jgi:hypothetical protein